MLWKKNLRKVPRRILLKIKTIKNRYIKIGCVKKIHRKDIAKGLYTHLRIIQHDNTISFPSTILPSSKQGKYSEFNINGQIVIRYDLPKETLYNTVEAPNYGDPYRGTHTVDLPYEKYPRDFIAPRNNTINIECPDVSGNLEYYLFKFEVDEILDKHSMEFSDRLLYCLNLLQENIGDCDAQQADATLKDYIQTLNVEWEILPPGTLEETIVRLFRRKPPTKQESCVVKERYEFFQSLKPKNHVYGRSGFQRYFGALLEDDLVIFENVKYGNAIYVMFENWEELSQKSRIELLSGRCGTNFERVIHIRGWKGKVREIIKNHQKR